MTWAARRQTDCIVRHGEADGYTYNEGRGLTLEVHVDPREGAVVVSDTQKQNAVCLVPEDAIKLAELLVAAARSEEAQ